MLQSIRDHTQGWIAGIIISLLILSFALWGIHSYLIGGANTAVVAKVDDIEITQSQLAVAYERLRRQLQMQDGSNYQLPERAESGLKGRALQTLIDMQILKQASLKQNYRISSRQVDSYLESIPEFQVKGQFSTERFEQLLATTLFSARDFFDVVQTSLLIDQPRLGLVLTSFALPNEIADTVDLVSQERNIQYIILPFQYFSNQPITLSNDKILAYYKSHESEFKTPEQVSIEYIAFSVKDLMPSVAVTDQKLRDFYNENINSYTQPFDVVKDKVKETLSHQLAQEKFTDLKEKIANITYEHPDSLTPAAQKLGLTIKTSELFTKENGGKDISSNTKVREAAYSNDVLNLQNNSDIIQLDSDSLIVLRVKSHTPATLLSLQVVKNQITDKLRAEEIETKTAQLANDIKNKLQTGDSPENIAKQYPLTWINAGFIGRRSNKVDSAILDTAFALPKPQKNNKVFYATTKVANGYAIVTTTAIESSGSNVSKDQYQVFAEQIQNTEGLLEYELYKQSLMKNANVVMQN